MALTKNVNKETKENKAAAWMNYEIPMADGSTLRATKGLPIFQNPQYPDKHQDILVELAKKHGGSFKIMMPVTITINNGSVLDKINLDDIAVLPAD